MAKNQINHYMSDPSWASGSAKPGATKVAAADQLTGSPKPKGKAPIKIKAKNKGAFTKKASAAGESVPGYAQEVLAPGSKASPATKKQANFARNSRGWNKSKA